MFLVSRVSLQVEVDCLHNSERLRYVCPFCDKVHFSQINLVFKGSLVELCDDSVGIVLKMNYFKAES